jgi:hypothetical protein
MNKLNHTSSANLKVLSEGELGQVVGGRGWGHHGWSRNHGEGSGKGNGGQKNNGSFSQFSQSRQGGLTIINNGTLIIA